MFRLAGRLLTALLLIAANGNWLLSQGLGASGSSGSSGSNGSRAVIGTGTGTGSEAGIGKIDQSKAAHAPKETKRDASIFVNEAFVQLVCADVKVHITQIDQMAKVIYVARQLNEKQKCHDKFVAALNELDPILKMPREKLCSSESFRMLRNYHFRFIAPLKDLNEAPVQFEPTPRGIIRQQLRANPSSNKIQLDEYNQELAIPISVRYFFLAFMLQLSGQCKKNLLLNLSQDSRSMLVSREHGLMELFNFDSPLGKFISNDLSDIDFGNAIYMPELEGEIKRGDLEANQALTTFVKVSTNKNSFVTELIDACQNRFKPLYEQLLLPVVRLAKLGYNYRGKELNVNEQSYLSGAEVKSWLGALHICHTIERVIVIKSEDSEDEHLVSCKRRTALDKKEEEEEEEEAEIENEGKVQLMTPAEVAQSRLRPAEVEENSHLQPAYKVRHSYVMPNELWLQDEWAIDEELLRGSPRSGLLFKFRRPLRQARYKVSRLFALLNPNRSAHYRYNSLWYSGALNFISSLSNVASISVTLVLAFKVVC